MSHDVISFKVDPELKKLAQETATKLNVSIEEVLGRELRRFAAEQSTIFTLPETTYEQMIELLTTAKEQVRAGDYQTFNSNEQALDFAS